MLAPKGPHLPLAISWPCKEKVRMQVMPRAKSLGNELPSEPKTLGSGWHLASKAASTGVTSSAGRGSSAAQSPWARVLQGCLVGHKWAGKEKLAGSEKIHLNLIGLLFSNTEFAGFHGSCCNSFIWLFQETGQHQSPSCKHVLCFGQNLVSDLSVRALHSSGPC